MSCKMDSGGFRVHVGGECDVRGTYCALAVARLCNMMTPELVHGVAAFVRSCQTYEVYMMCVILLVIRVDLEQFLVLKRMVVMPTARLRHW